MALSNKQALHAIALFEAVKGVAALAASLGLLSLAHHDVRSLAYALIGHFHLNPEAHFPHLLLDYASLLGNQNLSNVVLLAWAYAALRLTEGYGLWKDRAWAEWLAALSGGIYLPWEVLHLVHHRTAINALVLLGNVVVVAYLVYRLWQRRGRTVASPRPTARP
jgi:uncharacterized membrane protein (DUF2068 family)